MFRLRLPSKSGGFRPGSAGFRLAEFLNSPRLPAGSVRVPEPGPMPGYIIARFQPHECLNSLRLSRTHPGSGAPAYAGLHHRQLSTAWVSEFAKASANSTWGQERRPMPGYIIARFQPHGCLNAPRLPQTPPGIRSFGLYQATSSPHARQSTATMGRRGCLCWPHAEQGRGPAARRTGGLPGRKAMPREVPSLRRAKVVGRGNGLVASIHTRRTCTQPPIIKRQLFPA